MQKDGTILYDLWRVNFGRKILWTRNHIENSYGVLQVWNSSDRNVKEKNSESEIKEKR